MGAELPLPDPPLLMEARWGHAAALFPASSQCQQRTQAVPTWPCRFRPTLEITGVSGLQAALSGLLGAARTHRAGTSGARDTFWVHAGGFAGDGIKTIIPARAVAKLAARLVPNQDPGAVLKLIEAHIQAHHPPACNVTIRELGFKGWPYSGRRHSRMISAATKVRFHCSRASS